MQSGRNGSDVTQKYKFTSNRGCVHVIILASFLSSRLCYFRLLSYSCFKRDVNENVKMQIVQNTYPNNPSVNRAGIIRERCLAVVLCKVRMGRPYHTEINVN